MRSLLLPGADLLSGAAAPVVQNLTKHPQDTTDREPTPPARETALGATDFERNGGEGGIRTIECGPLYRLVWPCSVTENTVLIVISVSARSHRRVPEVNSRRVCSTVPENVARDLSSVTSQSSY